MNAGFFKRGLAFVTDVLVVMTFVVVVFLGIATPIYASNVDNFYERFNDYREINEEYRKELTVLRVAYNEGELTEEAYTQAWQDLNARYYEDYPEIMHLGVDYTNFSYMFILLGYLIVFTVYMVILKGQSLGRRAMGLRLQGEVHVLSIVLRELFWKHLFWAFTLTLGFVIDAYMIILTHNKKAIRDHITKTTVIIKDTVDPLKI